MTNKKTSNLYRNICFDKPEMLTVPMSKPPSKLEQLTQENERLKGELEIAQKFHNLAVKERNLANYQVDKLQKELDQLKQQSNWISVNDRLPEQNQEVVYYYPAQCQGHRSNYLTPMHLIYKGKWSTPRKPSHWMPLPDPPKQEEIVE